MWARLRVYRAIMRRCQWATFSPVDSVYFVSASRIRASWTLGRSRRSSSVNVQAEEFVALLQIRIFDGDFGQAVGVRIQQLHVEMFWVRTRRLLRRFHRVEQRVEQIERDHDDDVRGWVGALKLPGHGVGVRR